MFFYEYLFVRASLVYLIYTTLLGFPFYLEPGWMAYLRSSHVHAGLVGFLLNIVFGVAYWMMPRPGQLKQPRLEAATFYTPQHRPGAAPGLRTLRAGPALGGTAGTTRPSARCSSSRRCCSLSTPCSDASLLMKCFGNCVS